MRYDLRVVGNWANYYLRSVKVWKVCSGVTMLYVLMFS